jgi:hypothetical protein
MKVSIPGEPLQEIPVVVLRAHAPQRTPEPFVPFTNFATDCQKPVVGLSEPYKFQRVPGILLAGRIAKVAVIFVLPKQLILGWTGAC